MTVFFLFFLFVLGVSMGSFLGVLVDRLPQGQSILGRSHCDFCKKKIPWYDLLPLLSFINLGGKCRYCQKKISYFYFLIELITGVFFVLVFFLPDLQDNIISFRTLFWLGIISCLIVIFFSDLKYQIIPDSIQISLFIFGFFLKVEETERIFCLKQLLDCYLIKMSENFIAGAVVMLPILFLYWVTGGRGMGFGDVKMSFVIGFLLGVKGGLLALYFAFIIGAVTGLILILLKRKKLKSKIAFGPFLVFGTLILIYFQNQILFLVNKIYGF
ncbi:MAG: prepilin peptidase [Microgenomates group bacterium]|nr:prepilin peptidase [Microgenomates group bacterium]